MKSRSFDQLKGKSLSVSEVQSDCDPIVKNKDVSPTLKSYNGKHTLDPEGVAWPCGLVAKSVFNDRYALKENKANGKSITINQDNIAWESDKEYKFKNGNGDPSKGLNWDDVQWMNVEDGNYYFINIYVYF